MPAVSVIIPNYNHVHFLKQRIDSVLNQTFQDFEVIILDDASTDKSREVIEKYRNHHKVKEIVYNEANSGSTFKQWKKGIELASGEFIWIAESDDVSEINFINELITVLINDKNIVLAYCQSNRINSEGRKFGDWLNWTADLESAEIFNTQFTMNGTDFIKKFLIYKNVIPNASAVIFRKKAFIAAGGVNSNIKYCADWLIWMKMLTLGRVYYNNHSHNNFRKHKDSVISSAFQEEKFLKKYDIKMRKAFHNFIGPRIGNFEITAINLKLYRQELRIEKNFCVLNNRRMKAFKYTIQLLLTA